MAVVNGTVTPKLGPDNKPLVYYLDGGFRMAPCTINIPAGSVWAVADQIRLIGAYASDFSSQYGFKFIKQIIFNGNFVAKTLTGVTTGQVKGEWFAMPVDGQTAGQRLIVYVGGAGATGPLAEDYLGDASTFTTAATCEAQVYF